MRELVAQHGRFVTRMLRRAGVPRSDVEDELQRAFMVVAGRLDDVRPGSERSFLFKVACNTASHARRALARRREFPSDRLPDQVEVRGTPEELMARKQTQSMFDDVLAAMDDSMRAAFVLYELEGMATNEIAQLLAVPRGTVASRLRRARAQLRKHAAAVELAWDLGMEAAVDEEPRMSRCESTTALEHALLAAGLGVDRTSEIRAATLACLGLR